MPERTASITSMNAQNRVIASKPKAAAAIKMDVDLGTIEPGKLADIVAVDGDPLKNIALLQQKKRIQLVMKEGRVYADRRPGKSKNVVNVNPGDWKIIDYL